MKSWILIIWVLCYWSRRDKMGQRCPHFPLPRHFLQLFLEDSKAFPGLGQSFWPCLPAPCRVTSFLPPVPPSCSLGHEPKFTIARDQYNDRSTAATALICFVLAQSSRKDNMTKMDDNGASLPGSNIRWEQVWPTAGNAKHSRQWVIYQDCAHSDHARISIYQFSAVRTLHTRGPISWELSTFLQAVLAQESKTKNDLVWSGIVLFTNTALDEIDLS